MQIQNATHGSHNATHGSHNATQAPRTIVRGGLHPLPGCDRWDPMATQLQMLWIPRLLHNRC